MRYRLIKEYPGSCKLDHILSTSDYRRKGNCYSNPIYGINEKNINNFNEYWEVCEGVKSYYIVFTDDEYSLEKWKPHLIKTNEAYPLTNVKYFLEEQHAIDFILKYKKLYEKENKRTIEFEKLIGFFR